MSKEEFWTQIRDGLKEGLNYTVHKTEELTRIGRLKVEIYAQKRRIARQFADLGGQVYLLLGADEPMEVEADTRVRELVLELKKMEVGLEDIETELAEARKGSDVENHETGTGESITVQVETSDLNEEAVDVQSEAVEDVVEDFVEDVEDEDEKKEQPKTEDGA
jgi:hypothetical protein